MQATPDHETVYNTIDEYEMASLSCRAEPMRGGELCSTPRLSRLSCETGLLSPSMQGEGTVSTQPQKRRCYQQGRRRRERLTLPTCPLRWATICQRRNTLTKQVQKGRGNHQRGRRREEGCKLTQNTRLLMSLWTTIPLMNMRWQAWGPELNWLQVVSCAAPSVVPSLLWSRAAASLHAGGGDCIDPGPEGEGPPIREEEVKMQANPAYLRIKKCQRKN